MLIRSPREVWQDRVQGKWVEGGCLLEARKPLRGLAHRTPRAGGRLYLQAPVPCPQWGNDFQNSNDISIIASLQITTTIPKTPRLTPRTTR